jgi:hypothetical protein
MAGSPLRQDKQRGIKGNYYRPKGRGIKPLSAFGGLVRRRRIKVFKIITDIVIRVH